MATIEGHVCGINVRDAGAGHRLILTVSDAELGVVEIDVGSAPAPERDEPHGGLMFAGQRLEVETDKADRKAKQAKGLSARVVPETKAPDRSK